MIYIQTANGLQAVTQPNDAITAERIIQALGYTPADATKLGFFEDESGALVVADEVGHIIAKIDANGFQTTTIDANYIRIDGEDLISKLQDLETKFNNIEIPEATEVDLSNYYNKSEVDAKIPDVSGFAKTSDIPSHEAYDNHVANNDIHVTSSEKETWNNKSDFDGDYNKLSNAPQILNDSQDEMVVCDSNGNVIFRATADGLNCAAIYVNGVRVDAELPAYDATMEGAVLTIVDGKPTWVVEA